MVNTNQENLNNIVFESIEDSGWYATLLQIRDELKDSEEKALIEKAIAALKPEKTIADAVRIHGLKEVLRSLFKIGQDEPKNSKNHIPENIAAIIKAAIDH